MALYDVVHPCIVAGRHYTRPSTQPVEVSAAKAKALVEAGVIVPHEMPVEEQLPSLEVKAPFLDADEADDDEPAEEA